MVQEPDNPISFKSDLFACLDELAVNSEALASIVSQQYTLNLFQTRHSPREMCFCQASDRFAYLKLN